MLRFLTVIMFLLFALPCYAAPEYLDISPLREISDYPGDGSFQHVYGASVDESRDALLVLAGPPLTLYEFDSTTAAARARTRINADIDSPTGLLGCNGLTIVLHQGHGTAIAPDGSIMQDDPLPDSAPDLISKAICSPQGQLILMNPGTHLSVVNAKLEETFSLNLAVKPAKDDRGKRPKRITDVATGPMGELYILDETADAIWEYPAGGGRVRRIIEPRADAWSRSSTLVQPVLLAADTYNNFWLLDLSDGALRVLDNFGAVKTTVPRAGEHGFNFLDPIWLHVDRWNHLFLLDQGDVSVKIFDLNNLPDLNF